MNLNAAAERWARTWERAWTSADTGSIAALYAPGARYRSHPHRQPEPGGALAYTTRVFAEEVNVECRFGDPIASGDRAAVEWWATFREDERDVTLSGSTILRFDTEGLVVEHIDYWVASDGRLAPFPGWGTTPHP